MKIKHIHIENFGTLSKVDLDLKDNANFLLRDNAWGKTTLAVFIKVMFYGFCNEHKNDETANERLRYLPWQGGTYGGNIVFCIGTKEYRLSKTFGKKKSEDRCAIYDAKTNLSTTDFSLEPGMEIFGIDKSSFIKTIYVSGDADLSVTSGIQAKLSDASIFDADIHKYDRIRERIKKEKDYLNPNRKTGEIQKIYRELSMLKAQLSRKDSDEKRIFDLKEEIADMEYRREEILANLSRLHEEESDDSREPEHEAIEERETQFEEDTEDFVEKESEKPFLLQWRKKVIHFLHLDNIDPLEFFLTLRDEILDLLEDKIGDPREVIKDYVVLLLIVYFGYMLFHIIWGDGIFRAGTFFWMFISSALLTLILYLILRLTVYQKINPNKYGAKKTAESGDKADHSSNLPKDSSEEEMQEEDPEETKDFENIQKKEQRLELENALLQEEKEILEKLLLLRQEKIELSEIIDDHFQKEKIFFEKKKQYRELKQRYEILTSTEFFLEKAKISYTSKYMEPLKKAFDRYFTLFTRNTAGYRIRAGEQKEDLIKENLVMDANLEIRIDSNGVLHGTGVLSEGYKDVVGLCKRFALMEIMYQKERPPIILDDPFINLDDKKINGAMLFLMDLSKEGQVLYFTCNNSRFPKV